MEKLSPVAVFTSFTRVTLAHRDRLLAGPEGTARDLEPHGLATDGDDAERGIAEPERLPDADDLPATVHDEHCGGRLDGTHDCAKRDNTSRDGGTDGTPDPRTRSSGGARTPWPRSRGSAARTDPWRTSA